MTTIFTHGSRALAASVLAIVMSFSIGIYTTQAQTEDTALRDTIRAAILSDPRSQSMTPEEIESMTVALARQAESVGMTADDILWRPVTEEAGSQQQGAETCDGILCALNHAFGFDGSNYTIPIWLGAISLMLIFIIATIFEYRHLHKKKMQGEAPPAAPMSPQQPLQ